MKYCALRRALLASVAALSVGLAAPPATALVVYDPTNYAQNLLQAARALTPFPAGTGA